MFWASWEKPHPGSQHLTMSFIQDQILLIAVSLHLLTPLIKTSPSACQIICQISESMLSSSSAHSRKTYSLGLAAGPRRIEQIYYLQCINVRTLCFNGHCERRRDIAYSSGPDMHNDWVVLFIEGPFFQLRNVTKHSCFLGTSFYI